MKKMRLIFLILFVTLVLAGFVSAVPDLEVEAVEKNSVIIAELDRPAIFDLIVNNNGERDFFRIYTLVGVIMEPEGDFELPAGEKRFEIRAFLNEELRKRERGFVSFEYQMKGRSSGIFKDKLLVKVVPLAEVIEISADPLNPNDAEAVVVIKNLEDTDLGEFTVSLDSVFFSATETVSLGPEEEARIPVQLNKEGLEKIVAGPYLIFAEIELETVTVEDDGFIDYLEKEGTSVEKHSQGFIIRANLIKKTNKGNTQTTAHIELTKNIISRLFTTNSIEPSSITRSGFLVSYSWDKSLSPGDSLIVESTTNYTFPFLLVIVVVVGGFLVWRYTQNTVSVGKKVSFVRTKGGEFALKVKLRVKARKGVGKVNLTDFLPPMTTLYNQGRQPDKVDKATRRLMWGLGEMAKGEVKVFSYVIYSKLNVVGRFELPVARASFEIDGKMKQVISNRAFFAAEKD